MLPVGKDGCMVIICENHIDKSHAAFVVTNPILESVENEIEHTNHYSIGGKEMQLIVSNEFRMTISCNKFEVIFGEDLDKEFDPLNRVSIMELIDKIDHRLAAGGIDG